MVNSSPDEIFTSGLDIISVCPFNKTIDFEISRNVSDKLEFLQQEFQNVEFLVYGNATKVGDAKYLLNEIIIPKQKVGGASVDDVKVDGSFNTVIHKHPGANPMGFSYQDEIYVNGNHEFSLLIGSSHMYNVIGTARIKTDCGKYFKCDVKVRVGKRQIADETFVKSVDNIEVTKDINNITVSDTGIKKKIMNLIFGGEDKEDKSKDKDKDTDKHKGNKVQIIEKEKAGLKKSKGSANTAGIISTYDADANTKGTDKRETFYVKS